MPSFFHLLTGSVILAVAATVFIAAGKEGGGESPVVFKSQRQVPSRIHSHEDQAGSSLPPFSEAAIAQKCQKHEAGPPASFAFHREEWNSDDARSITSVDSSAPGNGVSFQGQLIEVKGYRPTPQGNALLVVMQPQGSTLSTAGLKASQISSEPVPETPAPVLSPTRQAAASRRRGFTPEEELFRTKWGWTAYAQVQREASLHPEENP